MGRKRTFLRVVADRVGLRKGWQVVEFTMQWAIVHHELGEAPERVEEYQEWWGDDFVSRATSYRHQALFRECFEAEGWETPSDYFAAAGIDPVDVSVGALTKDPLPT